MKVAPRIAALVSLWVAAAPAGALTITYTKIADASLPVPGWTANTGFGAPAVDGGVVAFHAYTGSHFGIYTGSGGALTTVAESGTPLPGGSGTFSWFSDPSISEGNVAFVANDDTFFMSPAVYSNLGGAVGLVADSTTLDPEGSGPLTIASQTPSIDGQNVGFVADRGLGWRGFYTSVAGALEMTANETTSVPGGGSELSLNGPPVLDGTQIAFRGFTSTSNGVYVADGGVARVVADENTPIPGGGGQLFVAFDPGLAIDSGNIVFEGFAEFSSGIYAEIGGVLVLISDTEFLHNGGFAAIDGDRIAYHGADLAGAGLFVYLGGTREVVIRMGDVLDGKVISGFEFGPHGFSGDQLAFTAHFEDSTYGVYLAQIPEPGAGLLLAAGLVALAARRRSMHRPR